MSIDVAPRSSPRGAPLDLRAPSETSVRALLSVAPAERGIEWLKVSLQQAIEIEHATIPPYLTALWSIESGEEVRNILKSVISDEMRHMGLACNMLVAIGGTPRLNVHGFIPRYPGSLPGGVLPGLKLTLGKLTLDRVLNQFIAVERPAIPPTLANKTMTYPSIGEFYQAISAVFEALRPTLSPARQMSGHLGGPMAVLKTIDDVRETLTQIAREGEGIHDDDEPDPASPAALAHYYKFRTIYIGKQLVKIGHGKWAFTGAHIPWPSAIRDMADVPPGGHGNMTLAFNSAYSEMLDLLQDAWANGDAGSLDASVKAMYKLERLAVALMHKPLPHQPGTYGPDFRYIPPAAR